MHTARNKACYKHASCASSGIEAALNGVNADNLTIEIYKAGMGSEMKNKTDKIWFLWLTSPLPASA